MAAPGFAEVYVQGALVTGDFPSCACVLIGQTPGIGWGVVPSDADGLPGVVAYPSDAAPAEDWPELGYIHFPLSMFDDTDEAVAGVVLNFGLADDGLELVWPDAGWFGVASPFLFARLCRPRLSLQVALSLLLGAVVVERVVVEMPVPMRMVLRCFLLLAAAVGV